MSTWPTSASPLDPWGEARLSFAPDHQVECGDDLKSLDQGGNTGFDRRDRDGLAFVSKSHPIVMRRAIVLAGGIR
jgi:hypothetical protein